MTPKQSNQPMPLARLGNLPPHLAAFLHERGIVTCEQAYELVVRLLALDPQRALPARIHPADLVRLRQQLDTVIPERQRVSLTEAAAFRWTSERPLGVLPPEDVAIEPPDESASGVEPEHQEKPAPPQTSGETIPGGQQP